MENLSLRDKSKLDKIHLKNVVLPILSLSFYHKRMQFSINNYPFHAVHSIFIHLSLQNVGKLQLRHKFGENLVPNEVLNNLRRDPCGLEPKRYVLHT